MNRRLFILTCFCLFFTACLSNEDPNTNPSSEQVTFLVSNETPGSDGAVMWEKGDLIDLFLGDKKYSLSASNDAPSQEAIFNCLSESVTWNVGEDVWAVFPHSDGNTFDGTSLALELTDNQSAISGQIDKNLRISVAHSKDSKLTFFNICSGIKFSLTEENVVSVSFRGNNSEPLAGKVEVGFDQDGKPVVTDYLSIKTEIILSAPLGETLKKDAWYYFACLPAELTRGYTMTITKADGQTIERKTEMPCQYNRSTVSSVAGVDLEFYIADVYSVADDFDRIVWKDNSHFAITNYYENGLMREQVFICDDDTLGINYSRQGFPQILYTNDECFYFGGFDNEDVRVAHKDNNGTEEFFDLDLGSYWQEHAALIRQFNAETRVSNFYKQLLDNSEQLFTQLLLSRLGPRLFSPAGALISFGLSSCAYMLSDNPTYLTVAEYTAAAGSIVFAFCLGSNPIGWATIGYYALWYGTQWGAKWLGSRTHEYEQFYHRLYGDVSLVPSSGVFSWQGGDFDIELTFGLSSFDLNQLDWEIVEKPGFVTINSISDKVPHSLSCSVGVNETNTIRTGQIRIRLINVYDQEDDLTFSIEQDTKMIVTPKSLFFNEIETKEIWVHSTDSWKVIDSPTWLTIDRIGLDTDKDCCLKVTPKDQDYHLGMITLEATVRGAETVDAWTYQETVTVEVDCPLYYLGRKLCPDGNHPHAIDLGLSVKWACCDVGASHPLEHGSYFAWGETKTKEYKSENYYPVTYTMSDYQWFKTGQKIVDGIVYQLSGYTRYNSEPSLGYDGFTDGKTTLDLEDDAAHANWGGGWRMPTKEELDELNDLCSWYNYTTSKSLYSGGGVATGPNGNSILMNNKGCYGPTTFGTYGWYHANYWTSTLDTHIDGYYHDVFAWGVQADHRYIGQAVRPVCD